MIELSFRFKVDEKEEESPITVELSRPDTGVRTDVVSFEVPLDEAVLEELRWYLELFAKWPTGPDYERAERIEDQLEGWGRALLNGVIEQREAARLWQQFVDEPAEGKVLTVDADAPLLLRLPWELLADEGGHLFAQEIAVRRRLSKATSSPVKPFPTSLDRCQLPVRLLVVVSRPDDAQFIDSRADSEALLSGLEELGEQAVVEFLYPPTLKALTNRLRDKKAPPVHLVHFDGHGVYDSQKGVGCLLFENEQHKKDEVKAARLGTLLNKRGVPLMVLSACQSAKQDLGNPYASVAARLIEAGVGSVLAMNYSVLVVTAKKFVRAFYGALANGMTVGQAVDEGRTTLLSDIERHTITRRNRKGKQVEETVRLHDWFLPALYQQAKDPIVFTRHESSLISQAKALPLALTDASVPGGLPERPLHGFHGRNRDLLQLERAFAERQLIILHGFGGIGKTALAVEAGRWFYRTGRFAGGVAFVSFEQGGSLQQLISWVGQAISGDADFMAREGDASRRLTELLRAQRCLIILDNFESVLGREPLMPPAELKEVLDTVWAWGKVGTRILLTTRDTTLNDPRFGRGKACKHIQLSGLSPDDALTLAKSVLENHDIEPATIDREALTEFMERLGGHPLSLYLVLPHLRHHSLTELTTHFSELLPGFTSGAAKERNQSLSLSLNYSLQRLSEQQRALLPRLAVFEGGAIESRLLQITEIPAAEWQVLRAALEQALITPERVDGVKVPFLRFHPVLAPFLRSQAPPDAERSSLRQRHTARYYALANYLYHEDSRNPIGVRALVRHELPNLRRALHEQLIQGDIDNASDMATAIARFLYIFGRWRERDQMLQKVAQAAHLQQATGFTHAEYLRETNLGEAELQRNNLQAAFQRFTHLLTRIESLPQGTHLGTGSYEHCLTLVYLARCLSDGGQPAAAEQHLHQALSVIQALIALKPDNQLIVQCCAVLTGLGDVLTEQGNYAQAKAAYEEGLEVNKQLGNTRGQGVILGQLGTLAILQREYNEAKQRHLEAREIHIVLGDLQGQAIGWYKLGRVAEWQKQWAEAERYYRQALTIHEEQGNMASVAKTCGQLANLMISAGRSPEAEGWYKRVIELTDNKVVEAKTLNNLADLLVDEVRAKGAPASRLAEARNYAEQALAIRDKLEASSQIWRTYSILVQIAKLEGHHADVQTYRRRERETFAAFAGNRWHIEHQYNQLIANIAAAAQGDEQMRVLVEEVFVSWEASDSDKVMPPVIRRIWAGERDWHALCEQLHANQALLVKMVLEALEELSTDSAANANLGSGLNGLSGEEALEEAVGAEEEAVGAEEEAVGAEEEEKKGIWNRVQGWFGR